MTISPDKNVRLIKLLFVDAFIVSSSIKGTEKHFSYVDLLNMYKKDCVTSKMQLIGFLFSSM